MQADVVAPRAGDVGVIGLDLVRVLGALQAFGGVAEDAKAIAGVGGSVSPSANRKSRLPDLFNPADTWDAGQNDDVAVNGE